MSGDLRDGMLAVGECGSSLSISQYPCLVPTVKCVRNKPAYFAERLYKSMKASTDMYSLETSSQYPVYQY